MRREIPRMFAATLIVFALTGCNRKPTPFPAGNEDPAGTEATDDERAWIGILVEERALDGYAIGTQTVIESVVPGSPAADILREGDVLLGVDGIEVAGAEQFTDAVAAHAPGTVVIVAVRRDGKRRELDIRTGRRPGSSAMLDRVFTGKPLPPMGGIVSIARIDRRGSVVPGSQCVLQDEDVNSCPRYGSSDATHFAEGNATAVVFLNWIRSSGNEGVVGQLHTLQDRFSAKGLHVVAMTMAVPRAIPEVVREHGLHDVTVVSLFYADWDALPLAYLAGPSMLVLDKGGIVRGATIGTDNAAFSSLENELLPRLLATE